MSKNALDLAERLGTVVAIQQEIASITLDRHAILETVVKRAIDLTSAYGAIVELFEGEGTVITAASGTCLSMMGTHFSLTNSPAQSCVVQGEVLRCDNCEIDGRVVWETCDQIGARSLVAVPFVFRGKVSGGLTVVAPRTGHFNDLDAYALRLVAGIAGAGLSHATEYDEKRASEARFRLLFDRNIAGAFRSTASGKFLECNDAMAKMFGFESKEALAAVETWDLYESRSRREEFLDELRRNGSLTSFRLRLKKTSGEFFEIVVNVDILPAGGDESFILGTVLPNGTARGTGEAE